VIVDNSVAVLYEGAAAIRTEEAIQEYEKENKGGKDGK
jgi:hypothetical protein